jgi:hypothetical protein
MEDDMDTDGFACWHAVERRTPNGAGRLMFFAWAASPADAAVKAHAVMTDDGSGLDDVYELRDNPILLQLLETAPKDAVFALTVEDASGFMDDLRLHQPHLFLPQQPVG